MAAKNHITIPPGASALGDRTLAIVERMIGTVAEMHRVRNVLEKVKLDNELAAHYGVTEENALEIYNLIRALDIALENAVVTNVTHRLG